MVSCSVVLVKGLGAPVCKDREYRGSVGGYYSRGMCTSPEERDAAKGDLLTTRKETRAVCSHVGGCGSGRECHTYPVPGNNFILFLEQQNPIFFFL